MVVQALIVGSFEKDGHTEYTISVQEDERQWTVCKRYTDFCCLDRVLASAWHINRKPLPEKGWFGIRKHFNLGSFNENRQQGLQEYLSHLLNQVAVLSQVTPLAQFFETPARVSVAASVPTTQAVAAAPATPTQRTEAPQAVAATPAQALLGAQVAAPAMATPVAPAAAGSPVPAHGIGGAGLGVQAAAIGGIAALAGATGVALASAVNNGHTGNHGATGYHSSRHHEFGALRWDPSALCEGKRAEDRAMWLVNNRCMSLEAARHQVMNEFPMQFTGMLGGQMWNPNVMCDGHRAENRAMWLREHQGLSMMAAQQQVMREFPAAFRHGAAGGVMPVGGMMDIRCAAGMGGSIGHQRCFKCGGKGFCHDSSMSHDKGPREKCFFCETCNACSGTGALKDGGFSGMPGMVQPCFKCEGRGFSHDSSMPHDKAPHVKCFFCTECRPCGGRGAIHAATGNSGFLGPAASLPDFRPSPYCH